MGNKTLLKANLKRHKGALFGIFILTLLACAALGTVLIVWSNSEEYIGNELERAGFGELTAWVANLSDHRLWKTVLRLWKKSSVWKHRASSIQTMLQTKSNPTARDS